MSAPAPPPLPPPSALFGPSPSILSAKSPSSSTGSAADRSQLLIDIEKGTKLRSISNTFPSHQSNLTEQANGGHHSDPHKDRKNLLQAELCSTLQRRKNANKHQIQSSTMDQPDDVSTASTDAVEIPITNYKNPNFVIPKNSTIRAMKKQTEELKAKAAVAANQSHPRHIESEIGSIKRADEQDINDLTEMISKLPQGEAILEEINRSMQKLQQQAAKEKPTEKLMISHGKPNFVINGMKTPFMPKENGVKTTTRTTATKIPFIPKENGEKTTTTTTKIPFIPKESGVKATTIVPTAIVSPNETYSVNIERLKPVDMITPNHKPIDKIQVAEEQQQNGFPRSTIATRREQFERMQANDVQNAKSPINQRSVTPTMVKVSPLPARTAQPFRPPKAAQSPELKSPQIHRLHQEKLQNFETKTAVSFAKDLSATENRYPDMVKVTRSVSPDKNHPTNIFLSNVKLIIDSNGGVSIQK